MAITLLLAGVASTITWEIWARIVTPAVIGGELSPAGLVQAVFGFQNLLLAEAIHLLTGVIAYPLGYLLVARPLARSLLPSLHWSLLGLLYGVVLFVFALYVMAHLFAGFPAFIGWGNLAWMSLLGHLIFALVLAAVVQWRLRRG
ncbi:MAG: hypothetical protein Kilf2KO_21110 [Rhodospirillales bacterium]